MSDEQESGDEDSGEEMELDFEFEFSAEDKVREGEARNSVENNTEIMPIDRLNALPDCLLIRILTLLDMKEASITSVLSRRWKYLWTELPKLNFQEHSVDIEKIRRFVTRVHRTLVLRSGHSLDELSICFAHEECFSPDVSVWVEFAIKSKVKRLRLDLNSSRDCFYMLPQAIFSCSSLTWLAVKRCIVSPRITVDWKYLTELAIEDVELQEHVIQTILSRCPVLSSLDLIGCWGFELLEVNSQSLHELAVSDCEDENTGPLLEISAPYVQSLSISLFPIGKKKLKLTNIQSVVSVNIHFDVFDTSDITEVEMDDAMMFFEETKHVKELELNCQCLEVLAKLVENGRQLAKSKREYLIVYAYRNENCVSGVVGLLESSPNLVKLDINCCMPYQESDIDINWGQVARDDLACNLLHLKAINLFDCAYPYLNGEPMLSMARIMLKRAIVLEKMVVDAFESLTEFPLFFLEITQELLSFPRSSQKAVVVLRQ